MPSSRKSYQIALAFKQHIRDRANVCPLLESCAKLVVLVIEDIHWADEATLDLIRYLSRRIASLRVLVIATHRDDEIDRLHPLRRLLGSLAGAKAVHRIELARLSLAAVRELATGRVPDVEALHRQTAGNPFIVSEIVASSGRRQPHPARTPCQHTQEPLRRHEPRA